jgi:hypothetical protein
MFAKAIRAIFLASATVTSLMPKRPVANRAVRAPRPVRSGSSGPTVGGCAPPQPTPFMLLRSRPSAPARLPLR